MNLISSPDKLVAGFGLEPGKTRLIAIYANFHESQLTEQSGNSYFVDLSTKHPLAVKVKDNRSVKAELDSIIYADETFEGKDDANLVHSFTLDRNAKHDSGVAVLLALKSGETEQAIREHLENDVRRGATHTDVRGKEGYLNARARWASVLLRLDDHVGLAGMKTTALQYASLSHVKLTRSISTSKNDLMK